MVRSRELVRSNKDDEPRAACDVDTADEMNTVRNATV